MIEGFPAITSRLSQDYIPPELSPADCLDKQIEIWDLNEALGQKTPAEIAQLMKVAGARSSILFSLFVNHRVLSRSCYHELKPPEGPDIEADIRNFGLEILSHYFALTGSGI